MAKKQQQDQQQEQEDLQQQLPVEEKAPELKLLVKKNYPSVMHNDCVIKLRAGQKINDGYLRFMLQKHGIEFVANLSECDFD